MIALILLFFFTLTLSDVTLVLTYLAQATHPLVPPDTLESVLKTIANNFVSDRSSVETMAVGCVANWTT